MARVILLATLGGLLAGIFHMAALTGTLGGAIFAFLSEVPLFLVGLSMGLLAALIAGGVSAVVIGVVGGATSSLLFVVTTAGPLVFILRQALLNRVRPDGVTEWYPPGLLIAWLTGISAAGIALSAFMLADFPEGYAGAVRAWLGTGVERLMPAGIEQKAIDRALDQLAAIAPGVAAIFWVLLMSINGTLAQGMLTGFGRNIRTAPPIATLEVPSWTYYVFGAAMLVAIVVDNTVGYIARNLAIAFAVPFFFQGLAVVHALINRLTAWRFALFVFYLVLIVAGWPAVFVTALGLAEPFLKVRMRYGRPQGSEEK